MAKNRASANLSARQPPLLVVPSDQQDQTIKDVRWGVDDLRQLRHSGHIRIERLILHGLDNRQGKIELVDEQALINDEIERYFISQISFVSNKADWGARFTSADGEIPKMCRLLLGTPENFIEGSQQLARCLYDAMRPRTIAPGDFVVIVYTVDNEIYRNIALLKLDPDQRLVRNFSTAGGRRRVTISLANNLLPDSARLQKGALLTPEADYDITLLDTQAGPRTEGIAAFFYHNFLHAELGPSPRRRTRDFIRRCDTWLAAHSNQLSPADLMRFYNARREALKADVLDIPAFAGAALSSHTYLINDFERDLAVVAMQSDVAAEMYIPKFKVDRTAAEPITERVVLELDGGARLIVNPERLHDLVHLAPALTPENKYRIVIESLTLREVSDR